ncbi:MAG TPA: hypothetical protein V6C97_27075 [Oculatellaceae cyanobacterium]
MSVTEDTLHSLSVDYITATTKDRDAAKPFHNFASGLFRAQRDMGNDAKPWSGSGFKGWQCGQVQISMCDDACMVRLSSDEAARSWRKLVQLSQNISRLDLQATVVLPSSVTRRIDTHKRQAAAHSAKLDHLPIVRWIQDVRGGYTLYLGSRDSLVFGRIYDKWQRDQLDHFRDCVRYEVQFQKKLSRQIALAMSCTGSERPRIASHVSQFFRGRGVRLELPYDDGATYCCSRPRSDVDKHLEWLRKAVRPTVMRLIDADRGEDVLRALGLVTDD